MINYEIINTDALAGLKQLKSNTYDACITSPPYFGLRDYGITGQIGVEETPEEYVQRLVDVFREVRRVIKPDGTLWLNVGDSYSGSGKGRMRDGTHCKGTSKSCRYLGQTGGILTKQKTNCKAKDLIGIPWLLAFALREDGWYLRQDIIWNKVNAMPESVKDRCVKSHEYIFLLSKSKTYFFDEAEMKEPAKSNGKQEAQLRNKRSVWNVPTRGFKGAHFAVFPPDLIRPCILAGSRKSGAVLDPFSGSGTTVYVALQEGRNATGIELNPAYAELSRVNIETQISQLNFQQLP